MITVYIRDRSILTVGPKYEGFQPYGPGRDSHRSYDDAFVYAMQMAGQQALFGDGTIEVIDERSKDPA